MSGAELRPCIIKDASIGTGGNVYSIKAFLPGVPKGLIAWSEGQMIKKPSC